MDEAFTKVNKCIEHVAQELVESQASKKAKLIMLKIQQRKQDAELAAEKRKNEERLVQLSEQRKIKE